MAQITLINNTNEDLRIAIFKKPYRTPTLSTIAWRIEPLPIKSEPREVIIPEHHSVYVSYSLNPSERDDPHAGIKTSEIQIDSDTAKFTAKEEKTNDGGLNITLERVFTDLIDNEIHISNQTSIGIWGHITLDGEDIYPPQVIAPGRTLMEDVRTPMYLSVVNEGVNGGDFMIDDDFITEPIEVLSGDNVTVTGSKWEGYSLTK